MKPDMLPGSIRTLLMPAILLLATATASKAQYSPLAGSAAFCHPSSERRAETGAPALYRSVVQNTTIYNTDFVSAGVGGMRDVGTGSIVLGGVSGTVTRAYLYWHGVTNSTTDVGNSITVSATTVTGTNIGVSDNNCWGYNNSQAYRADVTALVQSRGNATYSLSGFGSLNPNGASLIVFFNDANSSNNRDVVIFDGNDSNIPFAGIPGNPNAPADPSGWDVLLSGINYTSGTANIQLHVADGQSFLDDALRINSGVLVPAGAVFQGTSVPGTDAIGAGGNLWDIRSFNVTSFLSPGPNTLNLTTGTNSDCLGLIVALIDLPAGVAPPTVFYSKPTGDLHNLLTWGINPDGSGPNPADFGAGKTFNLVNRAGIYTMTANWSVSGTVNIPSGSQLQINGNTLSIASKTGAGTFSGSLTSNLVALPSTLGTILFTFTPGSNSLNNLAVNLSANAAVGSPLDLYNTLTVDGFFNPASDLSQRFMTFKSGPTMTARLAPVTGIIGDGWVRTETYIPARRAWRMMNSTMNGSSSVSIAWREGAPINGNPYPGFGTHITGGPLYPSSTMNGFDNNPVGGESSIKRYNNATNTWDPLPSLAGVSPVTPSMIFIRGDRGIPLGYNDVPPTVTRLRDDGGFYIGPQTRPVLPNGFTVLPNLFQSPINFATLTRVNVQNNFYVWDPKMGGEFGVGAYVLISGNSSGTYDVIPASVSPESQYIQTNQSFMVRPQVAGTAGSITFKESDKVAIYNNVFRSSESTTATVPNAPVIADPKNGQGLRITLETTNDDKTIAVMDEVFTSYKSNYSVKIDDMDAVKMPNVAENLSILRENQELMLERKPLVDKQDVIALKLWNTKAQQYVLEFNPVNLNGTGLTATLGDAYLRTSTPVSLTEISRVKFTISSDPASARTDRFKVILLNKNNVSDAITSTIGKGGITAYPNPIDGTKLTLYFNDEEAGVYQVRLVNNAGQIVFSKSVQHGGGTATQTLQLNKKLPAGVYQLQVTGKVATTNINVISN